MGLLSTTFYQVKFYKSWHLIQMSFAFLPHFLEIFFPTGSNFQSVHRYIYFIDLNYFLNYIN